ncbi:RecX family transcriptional regulator [Actinomadura kijaniata]|uniref:RecX family transcriptional regulator n=1 Tax=Actinomadura kijaniata TaxID=46161 RepID=UPI00350E43FC
MGAPGADSAVDEAVGGDGKQARGSGKRRTRKVSAPQHGGIEEAAGGDDEQAQESVGRRAADMDAPSSGGGVTEAVGEGEERAQEPVGRRAADMDAPSSGGGVTEAVGEGEERAQESDRRDVRVDASSSVGGAAEGVGGGDEQAQEPAGRRAAHVEATPSDREVAEDADGERTRGTRRRRSARADASQAEEAVGGEWGQSAGRRRGQAAGGASPEEDAAGESEAADGAEERGGRSRRRGKRRKAPWDGSRSAWEEGTSREERAEQKTSDPEARAREICLRLLTGSPRTRSQLAESLKRKGIPDDVAERVLGRFADVGLIDDAAFAQAWVQSRHAGRGLARRALAAELRQRGVDQETVSEAVEALDSEQEEVRARELVERKLRSTRGVDPVKRTRRLVGMLARKGYSSGLAYRVVKEVLEAEGDDVPEGDWGADDTP